MAVQAKARSSELYEQDLYAWSEAQADRLRRRRFAELDLEHLVEEIEDWAGACTATSVLASGSPWNTS
jgi:hypothetical protein